MISSLSKHMHPLPALPFGRIITDIDLSRASLASNPSLRHDLVAALYQHGLLLFRNQSHLTPHDEVSFCKLFSHQPDDDDDGGDATRVSYTGGAATQHRLPHHPQVALVGSYAVHNYYGLTAQSEGVYGRWPANQRAWHCDGLADTCPPPDLTSMRCLITPEEGGETLFASSVKAAELLPAKELVEEFGIHPEDVWVRYKLFEEYEIASVGTHLVRGAGSKGCGERGWDVNLAEGTTAPLVIRERHSNRRSMVGTYHISSVFCAATGKSLEFERANAYLAKAWAPGLADEYVYSHRWEVGDLAAWSNRLVIHSATSTIAYRGKERLHTRIRMRSAEEDGLVAWRDGR